MIRRSFFQRRTGEIRIRTQDYDPKAGCLPLDNEAAERDGKRKKKEKKK